MPSTEGTFYVWLAAQPPFVEVALGILFVVVLAPVVLAAAAGVLGHFEQLIETNLGIAHPSLPAARTTSIGPSIPAAFKAGKLENRTV
jgi:hypothetical protein